MKAIRSFHYADALSIEGAHEWASDTNCAREADFRIPLWKRIFDLTAILVTLPCWLPLMALVAGWVKIVSPGPAIFRQERIGYRRRQFMILKFRSMKPNAETAVHEQYLDELIRTNRPMAKLDADGDRRLIPGGGLLRASGLDELPQLLNVIFGDMTLVGPRPCTPFEFDRYTMRQKERVNAPPGLTGYWQVHGKNKTTFRRMIAMDLIYAKKMSPWLDLQIVAMTLPTVFKQVCESRQRKQSAPALRIPAKTGSPLV
jgi:lipopolysaccharide/colanic/teichoic acid biosynthesis glycosyltransferase